MLVGGYFSNGSGSGSGSGMGGSSDNVQLDSEGNIIFAPFDPVFVDDDNRVFLSQEDKNGRFYLEDGKLFVERLV